MKLRKKSLSFSNHTEICLCFPIKADLPSSTYNKHSLIVEDFQQAACIILFLNLFKLIYFSLHQAVINNSRAANYLPETLKGFTVISRSINMGSNTLLGRVPQRVTSLKPIMCMHDCVLSRCKRVWLCAILWTVAGQAPLSKGFSRQEYWNGLLCLSPRTNHTHHLIEKSTLKVIHMFSFTSMSKQDAFSYWHFSDNH